MANNSITVVICTHNRVNLLKKTIGFLNAAQKPDNLTIKLLVIANACSDATTHFLKDYCQSSGHHHLPLDFQLEPIAGKSHALNRAIGLIDEGFLCFVDDDHRVDRLFFCAISDAIHLYPEIKIFCGKILPDWTGEEPEWIHDTGPYKIYPLPVPHFEMGGEPTLVTKETKLPGGGNLIVHHSVFTIAGGFSTDLGPSGHNLAGSEDSDFVLRTLAADIRIRYLPNIIQHHYVDQDRLKFNYLIKKSYQRTRTLTLAKFNQSQRPPRYLWRKLAENSLQAIFSLRWKKTRFFSMRVAATLGEIKGYLESKE